MNNVAKIRSDEQTPAQAKEWIDQAIDKGCKNSVDTDVLTDCLSRLSYTDMGLALKKAADFLELENTKFIEKDALAKKKAREKAAGRRDDPSDLVLIEAEGGTLRSGVLVLEKALAATGFFYVTGELLVRLSKSQETNVLEARAQSPVGLRGDVLQFTVWERAGNRINPPIEYVQYLAKLERYENMPALKGIAHQPYFNNSGELVLREGFDSDTGIYADYDPSDYNVPENPTKGEAKEALKLLLDTLKEFPFSTKNDKAAAVCAILTATVRASLPRAPMIHVRANLPGSGKGLLSQIIGAFGTSVEPPAVPFSDDKNEFRKQYVSQLISQPPVIIFDNLTCDIVDHSMLCSAITEGYIADRILGATKMVKVHTNTLNVSNGNNVGPTADMSRRVLELNLKPGPNPEQKVFERPNLLAEVRADRAMYVTAALTIIQAWIVAGSPTPETPLRTLGNFGDWTKFCRQPLVWLGAPDPAENVFASIKTNPDKMKTISMIEAISREFGTEEFTTPCLINRLGLEVLLLDLFPSKKDEGAISPERLGKWLSSKVGHSHENCELALVNPKRPPKYALTERIPTADDYKKASEGD